MLRRGLVLDLSVALGRHQSLEFTSREKWHTQALQEAIQI